MTDFHRSPECEISRQYIKWKPHWYTYVCGQRDGWTIWRKWQALFRTKKNEI